LALTLKAEATMPDKFKEYRSVTDFPLHTQKLTREELEVNYHDIRKEYRNLSTSRSQLVRRQSEAKAKVRDLRQSLVQVSSALENLSDEKMRLQKSLSHSVKLQNDLQNERESLSLKVTDLRKKLDATTQLLDDFEQVYEEVKEQKGINGFFRLLQAAKRLLTTDINALLMKRAEVEDQDDFAKEDTASINRSLRDDVG
jgi:chromosome segregation ATPase